MDSNKIQQSITFGVELKRCAECDAFLASRRRVARWAYRVPRCPQLSVSRDVKCSACDFAFPQRDGDRWLFCPHCGAKMED